MEQEKQQKKAGYDRQQKAYFLTLNNPAKNGYTHEKIIEIIHSRFPNRIYWCMCDEQGTTYHTHIYILLSKKKRWSSVQNAFEHGHIEAETKGSPQECRAYIRKEGDKHKDKAETNFPDTFYEEGTIPEIYVSADRTEMLLQAEELLGRGMTPDGIMEKSMIFRQYENVIRRQFYANRFRETPPIREITVIWHLGASGSGKTYSYVTLCEEHGDENVYYASDYSNSCTALFDGYQAQPYLFLDEVKPDSFRYGFLLQLLHGYRTPIHARYSNVYSLWTQVDISSIYTPEELYKGMVDISARSTDSLYQLTRRITRYVYHWKTQDQQYHFLEIPAEEFTTYEELQSRAETGLEDGFLPVTGETPFP